MSTGLPNSIRMPEDTPNWMRTEEFVPPPEVEEPIEQLPEQEEFWRPPVRFGIEGRMMYKEVRWWIRR